MHRMPDLDDTLQDLSELVARKLVILDASMQVVGYSIHESEVDRRRLSRILAHSDSWTPPGSTTAAYDIAPVPRLGDCLFLRLTDGDHFILGYLLLVLGDGQPPSENDLGTLLDSAEQLGSLLSVRNLRTEEAHARSRTLTVDLIRGTKRERERAAEALLAEGILSASGRYCAVALGTDPRDVSPSDVHKSELAVTQALDFVAATSTASVIGASLDDALGVLVFPRPVVVSRLVGILERRPVSGVRAGIGPLLDLAETHRSFERARIAWRASYLAPQDHPIVLGWEEAGLDGILARLPLEDFTVDDLPEAARRVVVSGVDLSMLATLNCYLDHGGDAQQTARALTIHRSTLYYRLDKLREIVDGDLRDGRLRRELHTGLRIARLAHLGQWSR